MTRETIDTVESAEKRRSSQVYAEQFGVPEQAIAREKAYFMSRPLSEHYPATVGSVLVLVAAAARDHIPSCRRRRCRTCEELRNALAVFAALDRARQEMTQ